MKHMVSSVTIGACLVLASVGAVFGAANPSGTGQPSQTCQLLGTPLGSATPGKAGAPTNTGSPFSGGKSDAVYAGGGKNPAPQASSLAVSQYDVACFQQTQIP